MPLNSNLKILYWTCLPSQSTTKTGPKKSKFKTCLEAEKRLLADLQISEHCFNYAENFILKYLVDILHFLITRKKFSVGKRLCHNNNTHVRINPHNALPSIHHHNFEKSLHHQQLVLAL